MDILLNPRPCVHPRSELTFEYFSKSLIVIRGSHSSSIQSSRRSESIKSQPTSPRGDTTQNNMTRLE